MAAIDPQIHAAIQAVVDYNWSAERADYEEQEAEGRERHVFRDLTRIAEWLDEAEPHGVMVATDAEHVAEGPYQLAYGYALGVLHSQPPGVSYGVRSERDVADFARAYRAEFERGTLTREVGSAFGEWRATGSVSE